MKKIILLIGLLVTCWQVNAQDYCTDGGPSSTFDTNVESVDLVGETATIAYLGCQNVGNGVAGVEDLTASQSADVIAGNSYTVDVQFGTCGGNYSSVGEAWIDFDSDGFFETIESIGTIAGIAPFTLQSFAVTVPSDAINGSSRMRVMQWEGGVLPLDPCGSFTYGSVVDFEIVISGGIDITCEQPFNVQLVEAFGSSADFTWDLAPNDQNGYIWEVFTAGADPDVDTPVSTGTVASGVSTANADGLSELTNYDFYVTTDCGATDGLSQRSNVVTFTTVFLCPAPSNVTVDGVVSDAFNINWNEIPNAANGYTWSVFNAGDDPTVDTPVFTGTEPFGTTSTTVTGLTDNTSYDVYLSADCDVDGTSELSNVVTVTTPCTAVLAPITENFDGANWTSGTGFNNTGDAIDNCWQRTPDGSGFFWGTRTGTTGSSTTGPSAANSTPNYIFTESSNGLSGDEAFLVSPLIDLSPLTDPALTFWYHMRGNNMGTLSVDVDAGSGFDLDVFTISGEQQTAESDPFIEQIVDLAAYAGQTVRIRFRAVKGGGFESDMAIDDFKVDEAPSCLKTYNLTLIETFDVEAEVSWSLISNATNGYIWEVYNAGDDPATSTPVSTGTFAAGTTTGIADGLTELTDYDLYIISDCGATDGLSELAGPLSFSTLATCPSPTNIAVSNITVDAAEVTWGESFNASNGYNWELFLDGDDPATATPIQSGNVAFGTTTLNLSGLTDNVDYDFYITSDCDTNGLSLTEGPISFLTLPLPPANDDICDAIPLTVGIIPPGNTYTNLGATPQTDEPAGTCFNGGINGSVWFTFVAPASGEVEVSTDIAGATLIDSEIAVYDAPTDCADPTTMGAELGCDQDGGTTVGLNSVINLTGLTGGTTYYVQVDQWGFTTPGDFGISVIDTNPPCPVPENVTLDNVSNITADFSWDDVAEATDGYNWFVFNQGADVTSDTPIVNGNVGSGVLTANVTGLASDTFYDFYVQSNCGTTIGLSILGTATTFQTDCDTFTTPFVEDFESFAPTEGSGPEFVREGCFEDLSPEFDYRWNIGLDSTPSTVSGPSTGNSGSQYIYADSGTGFGTQTAVLQTPTFDLSTLTQPTLSFFYHMFGSDVGSLAVDVDNGTTVDADVLILNGSQQNASNEPWKVAFVDLTAYSGQNISFIFRATRTTTFQGSDIALDDISVDEAPACLPVNNISIANIGDTSVDLSWVGNSTALSYNWELFLAGDDPSTATPVLTGSEAATTFTLAGLTASTSYDFYVTTDCGADGTSLVTGPFNFATAGCPVSDQCDFTFNLIDSFGDGWNGNTMDVLQNGVVVATLGTSFTTGNEFTEVISLCDGSNFELFWNDGGNYINEVGVEIIDPFDEIFFELQPDINNTNNTSLFTGVISCSPPPCPKPGSLSVSNLQPTSVTLNWGDNGNAVNGYNWSIFLQGEDPTVDAPQFSGSTPDGVTSVDVTGLAQFEEYEFYVEADCGTADGISTLDGPFFFATPCNIFVPDYLESFDTFLPNCWDEAGSGDPTAGPSDFGNSSWLHDQFLNGTGDDNSVNINLFFTGKEEWLISPSFDLSGDDYILQYIAAVTDFNNGNAPEGNGMGSDDEVQVLISEDDGLTWTELRTYNQSDFPSETGDVEVIDLSSFNGTVKFAFWGTEGTVDDTEDYDFFIDEFEVKVAPTCFDPNSLEVLSVTDTSADLNWQAGSSETNFDVEVVISGTPPTGVPTFEDVSVPFTATGLTSETTYDFYVRADCGPGDVSNWVGPTSFTTALTPVTIVVNDPSVNNTYCYDNDEVKEWLFVSSDFGSPSITPVEVIFNGGTIEDGTGSTDRFRVFNGFDETAPVLYDSDVDGTDLAGVTLAADSGAMYMLLESDIFGSCQNGVDVEVPFDFDVFAGVFSTVAFSDNNFKYYPNPVSSTMTIDSANPIESVQVFDILGKEVFSNNYEETSININMDALSSGTYLMKVSISGNSQTFRVIKD
ncbi:fibronectin type III domain-containing protein [Psychroflexus sp. MBR-150]|jgi:hypothetical protein